MELNIKKFSELTKDELYEIYHLRSAVFVVEQNCAYLDVDEWDRCSLHVYLKDEDGIEAYLRVLPQGTAFDEVSIGRVIAVKRRRGLGTQIVKAGIEAAKEYFNAGSITIEAQVYAKSLYEKLGFIEISDEFMDTGIPHIKMQLTLN